MSSLEEICRIREARFLSQKLKEDVANQEKLKIERENNLVTKCVALLQKDTHVLRICKFIQKYGLPKRNDFVIVDGEVYSLDDAQQMSDSMIFPFDNHQSQNEVNRLYRSQQNAFNAVDKRLSDEEIQELLLSKWVNSKRVSLDDCSLTCVSDDFFELMDLIDMDELLRHPFSRDKSDRRNMIAFWFRIHLAAQIYLIPEKIGITKDELLAKAEGQILGRIADLRDYKAMMCNLSVSPSPNDLVMCAGNCVETGRKHRFRTMVSFPGGSVYFCRMCASLLGIHGVSPLNSCSGGCGFNFSLEEMVKIGEVYFCRQCANFQRAMHVEEIPDFVSVDESLERTISSFGPEPIEDFDDD